MKTSTRPFRASASARPSTPHTVRLILLVLLLALAALLAGCTRDRPVTEGSTETVPASEDAVTPVGDAVPASGDSGTEGSTTGSGEPEVTISAPVTDSVGSGTPDPNAVVIEEYEVLPGDSLLSIATKFSSSIDELRSLNSLSTDLIQIGQMLNVPVKPAPPTPTPQPFTHVVESGESLSVIAARYGVSMADIIKANGTRLPDPNRLRPGSELVIPGQAPAAADGEEGATAAAAGTESGTQATHTVRAGQTLTQIAQMYNIPVADLQSANNISNRNNLRTGQVLVLPGLTAEQALLALSTKHTVESGESLSGIAKQYGVTTAQIMRANSLSNANNIFTGQVLIIPPPEQ